MLCYGPKTPIEWKSESATDRPTDRDEATNQLTRVGARDATQSSLKILKYSLNGRDGDKSVLEAYQHINCGHLNEIETERQQIISKHNAWLFRCCGGDER